MDINSVGKYIPNANADLEVLTFSPGIQASNLQSIPILTENFKYEVSQAAGSAAAVAAGLPPASATKAYIPNYASVINFANSDLADPGSAVRGFNITNLDKRISKSDSYIDIGGFF